MTCVRPSIAYSIDRFRKSGSVLTAAQRVKNQYCIRALLVELTIGLIRQSRVGKSITTQQFEGLVGGPKFQELSFGLVHVKKEPD